MSNQQKLVRTYEELSPEERATIDLRIKAETNKFKKGTTTKPEDTEPMYITSDNRNFMGGLDRARAHEVCIFTKEQLKYKYKQKRLPDWIYYVGLGEFIKPDMIKDTYLDGAYSFELLNDDNETIMEIEYIHSMLRLASVSKLKALFTEYGPGRYVIIYTTVERMGLHASERIDIKLFPFNGLSSRIENLLRELSE